MLNKYFLDFLATAPTQDIMDWRTFQQQNQQDPSTPKKKRARGTLLPRPSTSVQAEQLPLGTVSDLQLQEPPRGSSLPPPQFDDYSGLPQDAPAPMDPMQARIINQRQYTRELSDKNDPNYREVKNNDAGWKGRLADIMRQFLVRAGESWNQSDPRLDPTQRLLGALGGGAVGGFEGGFNPKVDEQRQRAYDINQSKQKEVELAEQLKQQNADLKARQEAAARQQGLITNQPVQVLDPITGQPVYVKGSEAYSQGQSAIRQAKGFENQAASQSRAQTFQRTENQKTRDNNYNIAIASAQTAADRQRIENQIQADRDHEANLEQYFQRKQERALEVSKLAASVAGGKILSDTTITQVNSNLARAQELDDNIRTEGSKERPDQRLINNLVRQRDTLIRQADEATMKLATEAGKAGGNAAQVEALVKAGREDQYPTRRAVPTYQPTIPQRPGAGYTPQGKVYPSPSALRSAFPGQSDAQIRQIIESQGGRFEK